MPPCGCKFSKQTFTQPQLLAPHCLKIKLNTTYREVIDRLGEMPRIWEALGLRRLPHFTIRLVYSCGAGGEAGGVLA